MIRHLFVIVFLLQQSCTTFNNKNIDCPKIKSPKGSEQTTVISKNESKVYVGFRGVDTVCSIKDNIVYMNVNLNLRTIRVNHDMDDYVPIKLSLVSVNSKNIEYDRDDFSYLQFMKEGYKTVDRVSNMTVDIPLGGQAYLGIIKKD